MTTQLSSSGQIYPSIGQSYLGELLQLCSELEYLTGHLISSPSDGNNKVWSNLIPVTEFRPEIHPNVL